MRSALRLAILLFAAVPAIAHAGLNVPLDQTRRITFSGTAANVVVGNPEIADVNIIDGRNLMIVGKRFGVTNLVVLDQRGRTLFDSEIVVSAGAGAVVSISRGAATAEYACTPFCQQVSGDAPQNPAINSGPSAAQTPSATQGLPASATPAP